MFVPEKDVCPFCDYNLLWRNVLGRQIRRLLSIHRPNNFKVCIKFPIPPPLWARKFFKSVGEECQALKKGRFYQGFGEIGNLGKKIKI